MLRLLFIQGGSRWKFDTDGNVYTDSNFNEHIWERYRGYCDDLTVILRCEQDVYSPQEAKRRFNLFDVSRSSFVVLPDLYRPVTNSLSISKRKYIDKIIAQEVKKADKIIIRSLGNVYTNTALKYARKYQKSYLVEVTGFVYESFWHHSLRGKVLAWPKELQYRRLMKDVPYALYVTNKALQKRYPCSGKILGCSDVELPDLNEKVLVKRIKKIKEENSKFVIGTAAFLDVRWKGQEQVIRAISKLKDEGITNVEYCLIGAGTGEKIISLAKKLGVENQIFLIGALSHEQVFSWLDKIDIYIQPSFQEGLCRSIVEAMSRGCPVIASDVGGNYELIEKDCLFKKGDYRQLANKLVYIMNRSVLCAKAKKNFEKAKEYQKDILDEKRDRFYKEFIENGL